MTERLTVALDDPGLYRRLKLRAAERGVPLKRLVESAIRDYLGPGSDEPGKLVDWEAWDRWQAELDALDAQLPPGPTDLSNVKKYLYGDEGQPAGVDSVPSPADKL